MKYMRGAKRVQTKSLGRLTKELLDRKKVETVAEQEDMAATKPEVKFNIQLSPVSSWLHHMSLVAISRG